MKKAWTLLMVGVIALAGCKKSSTGPGEGGEGGGGEGQASGVFALSGMISDFGTVIYVQDSLGQPITNATVEINNTLIPYFALMQAYFDSTVKFQNGATYTIDVDAGTYGSAHATLTAPTIDSVRITSPQEGTQVPVGEDLPVTWQYFGGSNNGYAALNFAYDNGDTAYGVWDMNGSTTNHTVPGSWLNMEGLADVTVYAYRYVTFPDLLNPRGDAATPYGTSAVGVATFHSVQITVGQGGGGGGGTGEYWAGLFVGVVDNLPLTFPNSAWSYDGTSGTFTATLSNIASYNEQFSATGVTFPASPLQVIGNLGDTLNLVISYQTADSLAGTWTLTGPHTGGGTWGGVRP